MKTLLAVKISIILFYHFDSPTRCCLCQPLFWSSTICFHGNCRLFLCSTICFTVTAASSEVALFVFTVTAASFEVILFVFTVTATSSDVGLFVFTVSTVEVVVVVVSVDAVSTSGTVNKQWFLKRYLLRVKEL